jgi:hypothetical protein
MRRFWFAILLYCAPRASAEEPPLVLSAPVTHSDWMLHPGAEWGPDGVHKMLDTCKAAGLARVHWRALDGGRSLYNSRLVDPQGKWEVDNFWHPVRPEDIRLVDRFVQKSPGERARILAQVEALNYSKFDSLGEAVRYGHEIGLQIDAWISINEDDHGWGIRSRFTKQHPESRWRKRDGTVYHSQQSFAYPEVMKYKLAVLDEIVSHYAVDGVFLDWLRTGDVRDNPQTDAAGVADHGYEHPLVDGFKREYGIDPLTLPNGDERWVRYRARTNTEFMRAARRIVREKRPAATVSVLCAHPWCYRGLNDKIDGNLRGLLLDVETWAKQGMIDAAVAGGYYLPGGTRELAYRALQKEIGGKADVWLYAWVPQNAADAEREASQASKLGAHQILFWEADYFDDGRPKSEISKALRSFPGRGAP